VRTFISEGAFGVKQKTETLSYIMKFLSPLLTLATVIAQGCCAKRE
jgi:hypothetical protein